MKTIFDITPGFVWKSACEIVIKQGSTIYDGDVQLKEVLDLFIEVEDAEKNDVILEKNADPDMIDWMVNKNFGGSEPILDWGYCYGTRFSNFKGVNQIEKIVTKLRKNPESKSATISLIDPSTDFDGHMPCIVALDFKIRDSKLYVTGFFRSQDVGKKLYADIIALGTIQKKISELLSIKKGSVKIFISSAHIYEADFEKINRFIK